MLQRKKQSRLHSRWDRQILNNRKPPIGQEKTKMATWGKRLQGRKSIDRTFGNTALRQDGRATVSGRQQTIQGRAEGPHRATAKRANSYKGQTVRPRTVGARQGFPSRAEVLVSVPGTQSSRPKDQKVLV